MHVSEALTLGAKRLRHAGIDEAQVECEHMLMKLLNVTRSVLHYDLCHLASEPSAQTAKRVLAAEQEKQFFDWIESREKRIPLAYLIGDVFFHSLKLKIRPGCLIPRPETERLVEEAIKIIRVDNSESPVLMDIGTGSGAIALAILTAFSKAKAVMVDISAEALKLARENAEQVGLINRVEFIQSDLFSDSFFLDRSLRFDLIVSNPPYLTAEDMASLQPEVAHEPPMALDGGKDGLDFYRRIIPEAKKFLKPQGWLGFEVGAGQAPAVCEELKRNGYDDLKVFKDHQQFERVILARATTINSRF